MKKLVLLLVSLIIVSNTFSQNKTYSTEKINGGSIKIDGIIDETGWDLVEWSDDFTQFEPVDGTTPSQKTEIKILYDNNNLYIAFKVYDNEPDKIEKRMSRRDSWDGDFVTAQIDSYFDKKTAFIFSVNVAGTRSDAISSDDDRYEFDDTWDPIWTAKTRLTDYGWSAEMGIPLSQLRFGKKNNQTWGIQFQRHIFRNKEWMMWKHIPKETSGWVSRFGELTGLKNLEPKRQIEIAPFMTTKFESYEKEIGNPFADGRDLSYNVGIDGKIGITNDLTLDFAVNPDFGQVEADPSEVNLSAYETFFSEKRPFFVEGNNITDFQITWGGNPWSSDNLLYSRRLGAQPHYYPEISEGEYLNMPENTRILGALKLTGKTKKGLSIGIIESFTNREYAVIDLEGKTRKEQVEPYTNYFAARIQKDMNNGNTILGGMLTSTNRFINDENLNFLNKAAYTGGIDFKQYFKEKIYLFEVKLVGSHITGSEEAIELQQTSSRRYFQQPDQNYMIYDPTRTSLSGYGGNVVFMKQSNKGLRYAANITWRSPGVELNDAGYLRRANSIFQFIWAGYRITEPVWIFRSISINSNQWAGWDFGGTTNFFGGNINAWSQFKNLWTVSFNINAEGLNKDNSILRGGPTMKLPGSLSYGFNIGSNTSKKLSVQSGIFKNKGFKDSYKSLMIYSGIKYQPINTLSVSLFPEFHYRNSNLQYVGTEVYNDEERYLFGQIDQKTFVLTARIDLNITPDFTIQYYAAPFISAGKYDDYKRITDPKAEAYSDRYSIYNTNQISEYIPEMEAYGISENGSLNYDYYIEKPDFNYQQFRSNLVLRWEYKPGSLIYLVWSQDRTDFTNDGNFNFVDDIKNMFSVSSKDVIMLKISYRFIQ